MAGPQRLFCLDSSNSCKIKVTRICDPATFWVVDLPNVCEHRRKINKIESLLSESRDKKELLDYLPDLQDLVAVQYSDMTLWYRGLIVERITYQGRETYKVFLVDHGIEIMTGISSMAALKSKLQYYPFQAYQVILHGMVPFHVSNRNTDDYSWSPDSLSVVEKMIASSEEILLKPLYKNGNRILGEIWLTTDGGKHVNLAEHLCRNKIAHFDTHVFWKVNNAASQHLASRWEDPLFNGDTSSPEDEEDYDDFIPPSALSEKRCIYHVLQGIEKPEKSSFILEDSYDENISAGRGIKRSGCTAKPQKKDSGNVDVTSKLHSVDAALLDVENDLFVGSSLPSSLISPRNDGNGYIKSSELTNCEKNFTNVPENVSEIPTSYNIANDVSGAPSCENGNKNNNLYMSQEKCTSPSESSTRSELSSLLCQIVKKKSPAKTSVDNDSSPVETRKDDKSSPLVSSKSLPTESLESKSSETPKPISSKPFIGEKMIDQVYVRNLFFVKEIEELKEATFHQNVVKALIKLKITKPMVIQRYMWPAVSRGLHSIIVSPSRGGKTLAYLLPLLSHCVSGERCTYTKPASGPLLLIVCVDSGRAQDIYNMCTAILKLGEIDNIVVEMLLGGGNETENKAALINGPQVLITMPSVLLKYMKMSPYITNFKRLCHFVLEDTDILFERFTKEVQFLLSRSRKSDKSSNNTCVQMIAVSETWSNCMDYVRQQFPQDSCICIGSPLQAAICAKIQPVLYIVDAEKKNEKLIEILEINELKKKAIIVCGGSQEVKSLSVLLKEQNFDINSIHEGDGSSRKDYITTEWERDKKNILCSDDVLKELDIKDAEFLVHYDLPHDKKTFGYRFSCLRLYHEPEAKRQYKSSTYIIVDHQNVQQFPALMSLLKRLGAKTSLEFDSVLEKVVKQREMQKSDMSLCEQLKAFGICWNKSRCPKRHIILKEIDCPKMIPSCGSVELRVVLVRNAGTYIARLTKHIDVNGKKTVIPDHYNTVSSRLQEYFSCSENRFICSSPKFGDICGWQEAVTECYYRVQVLEFVDTKKRDQVRIALIDEGKFQVCQVHSLLTLPDDLKSYSPQAVEVILCDIAPSLGDTCWSDTSTAYISRLISEYSSSADNDGRFIVGKIVLSLGNTLWLDALELRQHLRNLSTDVLLLSPKKALLGEHFAIERKDHVKELRNLCEDSGMKLPESKEGPTNLKKNVPKTNKVKPQWAHLPSDKLCEVSLDSVSNPGEFFVSQRDFAHSLRDLEEELNNLLDESQQSLTKIEVGIVCASRFSLDGRWYRTRIVQAMNDNEFEVFFVDHGDYEFVKRSDIAVLPEHLITRLPFQIIECRLVGVKANDGSWSEAAVAHMSDWQDSVELQFYVKVCVRETASHTSGNKYGVVLFSMDSNMKNEYFVLSEVLVKESAAVYAEEETHYIDSLHEEVAAAMNQLEEECASDDLDLPEETELNIDNSDDFEVDSDPDIYFDDAFMSIFRKAAEFLNVGEYNEEEVRARLNEMAADSEEEGHAPPTSINGTTISSAEAVHDDKEPRVMTTNIGTSSGIPAMSTSVRTPEVQWYEDLHSVHIKIMLTNVIDCDLEYDGKYLCFRTEVNDSDYFIRFWLFGKINIAESDYSIEGFCVHIRLIKLQTGIEWRKLEKVKKSILKVKLDAEHIEDVDRHGRLDYVQARSVGRLPVSNEGLPPPDGYEFVDDAGDAREESDEEHSEEDKVEEGLQDAFDPFS